MHEDPLDPAIGRAWRDPFPWDLLTGLAEIESRLAGSPGERRAATLMADAFETAGADPTIEPFDLTCWSRGTSSLSVRSLSERESGEPDKATDRAFETSALPYSPAGAVTGRLVDVGSGTPERIEATDLEGAIAITDIRTPPGRRHVHRMERFGHAIDAGAVGVVFVNHVPGQLPPTGALSFDIEATAPGVGVSAETGTWLREYTERNSEAVLSVDAATESGTGHNVHGALGPNTEETIVLCGHYDAHDIAEGALDNGCGAAVLATVARLLDEADLDRRVEVVATSAEELGLVGAEALADSLALDRVRAVVNIDGAGRFRDLRALTHGSTALEALATRVVETAGHPLSVAETPHPYSDHWPFLRNGVPTVQFHSDRPERTGSWERGWTHTRADTRDKADRRNLREHAILIALFVRELANNGTEIDRVPPEATRDRLREARAEPGMRAAGIWPADW